MSAILYGRISNPDWKVPWYDARHLTLLFGIRPSFAYGYLEPLSYLCQLTTIYACLADSQVHDSQKRAENAIISAVKSHVGPEFLNKLPLGIAAPLMEAARTCQLSPPADWPIAAYKAIGRNDLAASANHAPDMLFNDGYRAMKYYTVCTIVL
jgi:anaphase-promoting complex subunit 1